jgi:hypothetical protein
MLEYGQGVGQATGAGGQATGGGSQDLGAGAAAFVSNTIHTVSALPPEQLVALVVVMLVGMVFLRRAF